MVTFPNAKINLGLNILSKRTDGYHDISSVFYPIPFEDILEIIPSETFNFEITGLTVPGNKDQNLILNAYQLLRKGHDLPPVTIHLHKIIPMGAGLGGGSSDAAFTIKMLNTIFNLSLSNEQMEQYAGQLGSDCPFFIRNKPLLAEGTGNIFKNTVVDLKGKYLVLVCPDIHVGTADAYSKITPGIPDIPVDEIMEKVQLAQWKDHLYNDFERSVLPQFPKIRDIKDQLYASGALYASMTGSGAAVYGIFEKKPDAMAMGGKIFKL